MAGLALYLNIRPSKQVLYFFQQEKGGFSLILIIALHKPNQSIWLLRFAVAAVLHLSAK